MRCRLLFPMFIKTSTGGMQQVVISLLKGLRLKGLDVVLLCYSDSPLYSYAIDNGIKCEVIREYCGWWDIPRFLVKYYRIVKKYRGRVVTNDIFSHILLSLYPFEKKEIFVSHGGDYKNTGKEYATKTGLSAKIAKITFKRVTHFVAISNSQKDALIKNAKVSASKISIIFNGIEIQCKNNIATSLSGKLKYPIQLCMVGYIKPLKNQLVVIKAMDLLKEKNINCQLHIYGAISDENYYQTIVSEIEKMNLNDRVIFHGFCENKDDIYFEKDILISASHHEGFGLNIIEAFAYQIPVIAYRGAKGPADIITNGITGLLTENNLPKEYADLVMRYVNEHDLRKQIVTNAHKRCKESFSYEKMISEYISIFKSIYK